MYIQAIAAALGGLLVGFHSAIVAGALQFLSKEFALSAFDKGCVVSLFLLGGWLGSYLGGFLSDRIGRKKALFSAFIFFFLGTILFFTASVPLAIWLARGVLGIASGIALVVCPVFLGEIAPEGKKGFYISFNQLAITFGVLIAYTVSYLFSETGQWRFMIACALILEMLFFIGLFFLKEESKEKESEKSLVSLKELLKDRNFLSLLIVGMGLSFFQQITGINAIICYTPFIFTSTGIVSPDLAFLTTVALGALNFLVTIVSLWLIPKMAKKSLLLLGLMGMTISLFAFVFSSNFACEKAIILTSIIGFIISFATSLGPIVWIILATLFPTHCRATGMGLSTSVNWLTNYLVAFTFPQIVEAFGIKNSFLFYACMGILAIWFVFHKVPSSRRETIAS